MAPFPGARAVLSRQSTSWQWLVISHRHLDAVPYIQNVGLHGSCTALLALYTLTIGLRTDYGQLVLPPTSRAPSCINAQVEFKSSRCTRHRREISRHFDPRGLFWKCVTATSTSGIDSCNLRTPRHSRFDTLSFGKFLDLPTTYTVTV